MVKVDVWKRWNWVEKSLIASDSSINAAAHWTQLTGWLCRCKPCRIRSLLVASELQMEFSSSVFGGIAVSMITSVSPPFLSLFSSSRYCSFSSLLVLVKPLASYDMQSCSQVVPDSRIKWNFSQRSINDQCRCSDECVWWILLLAVGCVSHGLNVQVSSICTNFDSVTDLLRSIKNQFGGTNSQ